MGMNSAELRMMKVIDNNSKRIHNVAKKIWEFAEIDGRSSSPPPVDGRIEKEGFEVQRGLLGKHPKFGNEIDKSTAFKAVYKGKEDGPSLDCCWNTTHYPTVMPAVISNRSPVLRQPRPKEAFTISVPLSHTALRPKSRTVPSNIFWQAVI